MHVRREESADEKKIMIYSWVYTSVLMRFWFHWLWPRARLANTQNLNLIKPFTVCKAANDMLGKQSRHICMLISPQCAACATHNWPAATSAKVSWINEQSIPIYRNKDSTSDLKFLCVLGETLTNSVLRDWKKKNKIQSRTVLDGESWGVLHNLKWCITQIIALIKNCCMNLVKTRGILVSFGYLSDLWLYSIILLFSQIFISVLVFLREMYLYLEV